MKKILTMCVLAVLLISLSGCMIVALDGISGNAVHGTGDKVSRDFAVGSFTGLNIAGGYVIVYRQSQESSITVHMQENLFNYLDVSVDDGTLIVSSRRSFVVTPSNNPRLYVQAPSLTGVRLSGSTRFENSDKIVEDSFNLHTSGSSRVSLDIDADKVYVTTSGSSTIDLTVSADYLTIDSSGSTVMDIDMEVLWLNLESSGSSRFDFVGEAFNANFDTSGSTRINGLFLITRDAEVDSSGSTNIYIHVQNTLHVAARGSSRIRYMGNPHVTTNLSGSSSVQRYAPTE